MKSEGRAAAGDKAGTSNASEGGDKRNDGDGKKKVSKYSQIYLLHNNY